MVFIFIITNAVISFFFSRRIGRGDLGTATRSLICFGKVYLTQEQLLYQATKLFEIRLRHTAGNDLLLLTPTPASFASIADMGWVCFTRRPIPWRLLALFPRYPARLPIYQSCAAARGLDLSYKAKVMDRFKNDPPLIIITLIFSTLDRIE
jgi:hypothetical protein